MKKLIGILSAFTFFSLQARPLDVIKKEGTINVATEGAFPPFNMFKGGSKIVSGFEVDVFDAVAKEIGVKTNWITKPFDALLIGLDPKQERWDAVIASHGITPEREKAVDFSSPHYCTGGEIVSLEGGPQKVADLKGKSVAVQVGSTYLQNVQKVPGVGAVKTYPKDTDSMQNLLSKRADAWVTDKFVALEASKGQKALKLGEMLFTEKIGMAVQKGNSSLKAALDTGLAAIIKNGTYKKISEKYFGQDIRCL